MLSALDNDSIPMWAEVRSCAREADDAATRPRAPATNTRRGIIGGMGTLRAGGTRAPAS